MLRNANPPSELLSYVLSPAEKIALEDLIKIPEFATMTSLEEIKVLLRSNPYYSDKLLGWGRAIIGETNIAIFKAIKTAKTNLEKEATVLSADTVSQVLNNICKSVFPSMTINSHFTSEMANAIAACIATDLNIQNKPDVN